MILALPLIAFVFLLAYHGIALLASTYSRAKVVCLFSFIVPELELDNIERKVILLLML